MTQSSAHYLSVDQQLALVRRMDLIPSLVRRHLEEDITRLVDLPVEIQEQALADFCGDQDQDSLLKAKDWTESDLQMHVIALHQPSALWSWMCSMYWTGPAAQVYLGTCRPHS